MWPFKRKKISHEEACPIEVFAPELKMTPKLIVHLSDYEKPTLTMFWLEPYEHFFKVGKFTDFMNKKYLIKKLEFHPNKFEYHADLQLNESAPEMANQPSYLPVQLDS